MLPLSVLINKPARTIHLCSYRRSILWTQHLYKEEFNTAKQMKHFQPPDPLSDEIYGIIFKYLLKITSDTLKSNDSLSTDLCKWNLTGFLAIKLLLNK